MRYVGTTIRDQFAPHNVFIHSGDRSKEVGCKLNLPRILPAVSCQILLPMRATLRLFSLFATSSNPARVVRSMDKFLTRGKARLSCRGIRLSLWGAFRNAGHATSFPLDSNVLYTELGGSCLWRDVVKYAI